MFNAVSYYDSSPRWQNVNLFQNSTFFLRLIGIWNQVLLQPLPPIHWAHNQIMQPSESHSTIFSADILYNIIFHHHQLQGLNKIWFLSSLSKQGIELIELIGMQSNISVINKFMPYINIPSVVLKSATCHLPKKSNFSSPNVIHC